MKEIPSLELLPGDLERFSMQGPERLDDRVKILRGFVPEDNKLPSVPREHLRPQVSQVPRDRLGLLGIDGKGPTDQVDRTVVWPRVHGRHP